MFNPDKDEGRSVPVLGMLEVTLGVATSISGDSGSAGGSSLAARSGSSGRGSGRGCRSEVEARACACWPHTPCAKRVGDTGEEGVESVVVDSQEDMSME